MTLGGNHLGETTLITTTLSLPSFALRHLPQCLIWDGRLLLPKSFGKLLVPDSMFWKAYLLSTCSILIFITTADLKMIEVAGGTDMVRKTISAFQPEKASTCVLVDLHGYDTWPALAALEVDVLVFATMISQWNFRFKRISNPNIVQVQLDTVLLFNFPIIGQYIFTVSIPPLYPWSGTIRGPFRPLRHSCLGQTSWRLAAAGGQQSVWNQPCRAWITTGVGLPWFQTNGCSTSGYPRGEWHSWVSSYSETTWQAGGAF